MQGQKAPNMFVMNGNKWNAVTNQTLDNFALPSSAKVVHFLPSHTCDRVISTIVLEDGYAMLPINSEHVEVGWVDQVGLHFPDSRRRLLPSGVLMPGQASARGRQLQEAPAQGPHSFR